jgi:hypothetical protein
MTKEEDLKKKNNDDDTTGCRLNIKRSVTL